ncbi:MAG TPA: YIP1 family protein [Tissierellaceae bacterium]
MVRRIVTSLLIVLLLSFSISEKVTAFEPYNSYTYNYWLEPVPAPLPYVLLKIIDGEKLGIGEFKSPADVFVDNKGTIYVVDSGNNRLVCIREEKVTKVINQFEHNGKIDTFNNPQGLYVSKEGHIFVADTNNSRIVELDNNGSFRREIGIPETDLLPKDQPYRPLKVVVDQAGRIYIIAAGVNRGLIELDNEGNFRGFMGAPRVTPNPIEYLWKMISTREQRERMELFVPTEYSNICLDEEGFIYACSSYMSSRDISRGANPVVRLNPTGIDILRRYGYGPPIGDYISGRFEMSSRLVDIAVSQNGFYSVLDQERGRIFTYDFDGNLLYVFGCKGEQDGSFSQPVAIDYLNNDIVILDQERGTLNIFTETEYGKRVNKAVNLHYSGRYEDAEAVWTELLKYNANMDLAYIGLGKSLLRQNQFYEAMQYFKLANSRHYYNKAFKLYRREVVGERFGFIMLMIFVSIGVLIIITKLKRYLPINGKVFSSECMKGLKYSFHVIFHPFDGFWDLKYEKRGNLKAAFVLLILVIITYIVQRQYTGFLFNYNDLTKLNVMMEIISVFLPFVLWCISNWCVTTLADGEGSFKDIVISTSYALAPIIIINIPLVILSRIISLEEGAFYYFFSYLSIIWSIWLIIIGTMTTHQYSLRKTLVVIPVIIIGMGIIAFIALLFFNVIQRIMGFVYTVYREIVFRT